MRPPVKQPTSANASNQTLIQALRNGKYKQEYSDFNKTLAELTVPEQPPLMR